MSLATRTPLYLLLSLCFAGMPFLAVGGQVEDLLPPPARQAEKRFLGNDQRQQMIYQMRSPGGAAFSPDGKVLITGSGWWDVRTGRSLGQGTPLGHGEGLSAAFTPDGKQLITASWGGHQGVHPVSLWDVAKRQRLRSLDEDVNDTPFSAVAVAPEGKTIAFGAGMGRRSPTQNIILWDLASGDEIGQIASVLPVTQPRGQASLYQALAYSPDGRTLAVLLEGRIVLVEIATGKPRAEMTIQTSPVAVSPHQVTACGALAFSPDGRTLAAGCSDGAVHRFELLRGLELAPLPGHSSPVVALSWPPNGKQILSYSSDGQLFSWRNTPGREWRPKTGPLTADDLDSLWGVLRGDDPREIFGAVQTLAANPTQAIPFLRTRLLPVPQGEEERIDRLVGDLNKDYNTRKRAVIQLRKIGAPAGPALNRSQERGGYDELTRRLVYEFSSLLPSPDQMRAVRALRVLQRIGGPDASKFLKELSAGAPTAALTLQAKATLSQLPGDEPNKPEPTVDTLWKSLAGEDSAVAYRAMRSFANRPSAVALLRDRLKEGVSKEAFNDDPKRIEKLIGDLDSEDFAPREQASKALLGLGPMAVPSLRKALTKKASLEVQQRLEKLLAAASKGSPPELLRVGRILETFELMGTPEARQALEGLAKNQENRWLRRILTESLQRQQASKR